MNSKEVRDYLRGKEYPGKLNLTESELEVIRNHYFYGVSCASGFLESNDVVTSFDNRICLYDYAEDILKEVP